MQPALHVKLSRYQGMRTYKQSQFSYRNVSAVLVHALDGHTEYIAWVLGSTCICSCSV